MAATLITTSMAAGVNFTYITDTSADWGSVPNSTYFYDKVTKLVYYKTSTGSISGLFDIPTDTIGTQVIQIAFSDLTTAITTGTSKGYDIVPMDMTVTEVFASLLTPQTSGTIFTVNVKEAGTTILSTKITIDNNETSSLTAATPPVISDTTLTKGNLITIDVDQVGDGTAKGGILTIIGYAN